MNKVILLGRLARDPEVRYTKDNTAVARFTLAVDRMKKDDPTDFISCVAFRKTAELIERYCRKGSKMALEGKLQTGSYEKDGQKIYTTDVVVDRMEFAGGKREDDAAAPDAPAKEPQQIEGFEAVDDDIPF